MSLRETAWRFSGVTCLGHNFPVRRIPCIWNFFLGQYSMMMQLSPEKLSIRCLSLQCHDQYAYCHTDAVVS